MASGSVIEFVPARYPEVARIETSEYQIIQPEKPEVTLASSDDDYLEETGDEYSESSSESSDSASSEDESSSSSSSDNDTKELPPNSSHPPSNLENSDFYDINEKPDDRGTREPRRIHKSWPPSAKELVGLENQGVTCYQNAAIQTLLHIPALGQYLNEVLNGKHPKVAKSSVTHDFANLFKKLADKKESLFPKHMIRRLDDINPMLSEWNQEDSHEYFMSLVSRLQEDSVPRGQKLKSSILCDIFEGSVEQKVTCLKCKTVSTTTQDFYDLPVSFSESENNKSESYTLKRSINDFFTPETIEVNKADASTGYQCEKCKQKTKALKEIAISEAPEYLTIHIKRFKMDGNVSKKVKDTMEYPMELDLTEYEKVQHNRLKYKLLAVILHEGRTLTCGHYTALTRSINNQNQWIRYDDELKDKVPETEVISNSSAYILVYSRLLERPLKESKIVTKKAETKAVTKKAETKKAVAKKTGIKAAKKANKINKVDKKMVTKKSKTGKKASLKQKLPAKSGSRAPKRPSVETIDDIFSKKRKS